MFEMCKFLLALYYDFQCYSFRQLGCQMDLRSIVDILIGQVAYVDGCKLTK